MIDKKRFMPFLLSFAIIVIDQITKALVVYYIPEGGIAFSFFNDWLWIVHVRNNAIAFSLGAGFPNLVKYVFFIVFPIFLMALIAFCVISSKTDKEFTHFQKWCLAGIFGGGVGNLIDRIFRHLRVVDWISTDLDGFMGMERFPTWNIADGSVVVCVSLIVISIIVGEIKGNKNG